MSSSEPWQSDLEQMYREMYPTLYAYALRILKDHALAEEAIQDTFCIACAKREQALSNPKPRGWLMLTLKHVMQNMLRAQRKVQRLLFLTAGEEQPAEAPELLDVDVLFGDVSDSEDFRLLKRIALDQCTIVELAQDLGISVRSEERRVGKECM